MIPTTASLPLSSFRLESQDNKAEALKIYQDIKKKYVNSQLVQSYEIDKYIERVSE